MAEKTEKNSGGGQIIKALTSGRADSHRVGRFCADHPQAAGIAGQVLLGHYQYPRFSGI